jgi:hypothetical protein
MLSAERALERARIEDGLELDADVAAVAPAANRGHDLLAARTTAVQPGAHRMATAHLPTTAKVGLRTQGFTADRGQAALAFETDGSARPQGGLSDEPACPPKALHAEISVSAPHRRDNHR